MSHLSKAANSCDGRRRKLVRYCLQLLRFQTDSFGAMAALARGRASEYLNAFGRTIATPSDRKSSNSFAMPAGSCSFGTAHRSCLCCRQGVGSAAIKVPTPSRRQASQWSQHVCLPKKQPENAAPALGVHEIGNNLHACGRCLNHELVV